MTDNGLSISDGALLYPFRNEVLLRRDAITEYEQLVTGQRTALAMIRSICESLERIEAQLDNANNVGMVGRDADAEILDKSGADIKRGVRDDALPPPPPGIVYKTPMQFIGLDDE